MIPSGDPIGIRRSAFSRGGEGEKAEGPVGEEDPEPDRDRVMAQKEGGERIQEERDSEEGGLGLGPRDALIP